KSIPANRLMVVSGLYTQQRAPELLTLLAGVRDQETQRMRALRHHGPLDDASHGDEGDSAARDEDRELAVSLAQPAGSRVAAVEKVLERMRNGRYGVCERCEEDIPIERLEAMPSTVFCVDCQRERETTSKNIGADAPYLWVTASEPPSISSEISDSEG